MIHVRAGKTFSDLKVLQRDRFTHPSKEVVVIIGSSGKTFYAVMLEEPTVVNHHRWSILTDRAANINHVRKSRMFQLFNLFPPAALQNITLAPRRQTARKEACDLGMLARWA